MRRLLLAAITITMPIIATTASSDDWQNNPDFLLELKVERSIQDEFRAPESGFMYRYDGNPIYENPNEYLIIGDGKIHYVSYDPELFNQISSLVEDGEKDEAGIRKKLKKTDIVADFKSCPKIDSMLAGLYQSMIKQVASESFPQEAGIKIGGSFEYQLYFSNWKGNRFVYEFEDKTIQLNKEVHSLIEYVRNCGS